MNPRGLTGIEAQIWAAAYAAAYYQGRNVKHCIHVAEYAVKEFREAFPEEP